MNKTQDIKRISPAVTAILVIVSLSAPILFSLLLIHIFKDVGSTSEQYEQQREQSIVQVDTKSGNAPRERLVTLKDNRTVLCVDWNGSLSCDWENAK